MRTHFIRTAATLIALCSLACAGASVRPDARPASASMSDTKPPVAPTRAYEHRYHGEAIADPWHWLKNKKDPRVRAYLQAENTYTAAYEKRLAPLKKAIYDEFIGRLQQDDKEVPWRKGKWLYYRRTVKGRSYRLHCRRVARETALGPSTPEQVILDGNKLAEGKKHLGFGGISVSPDHRLLAYSVDFDGSERFTVRVRDLATGEDLPDRIPGAYYGLQWGNDNRTLLYTVPDHAHRPHQVRRHVLGTKADADEVLFTERDERFHVHLGKMRSERFITVQSESAVTSELRVLDADKPAGALRLGAARRQGIEYKATHHGEHLYIATNDGAVDFKLVKAPIAAPGVANWEVVIPERKGVLLEGVTAFAGHLVLRERKDGQQQIRVRPLHLRSKDTGGPGEHVIAFKEAVYAVYPTHNHEFHTTSLRLSLQSPRTPRTIIDYDMATKRRAVLKVQPVRGGHDPARYATARLWATSHDGVKVPITIAHRADLKPDRPHPCLIVAYAAYGYSYTPRFDRERLALLERGFVIAIAHARGGSDLGRRWKDAGKLEHKRNTFPDVVAVAEHLVKSGWTAPDRLALRGGSAGGLLVGATINLRPDLFAAALAMVPFVDVLNTMMDAKLPLTVTEYEEWGNPNNKKYFDAIRRYSPYDNVRAVRYPDLFVTAGLNDPRVHYWEPAKWVAKLRAKAAKSGLVLLKTKMGAGHGGASGRYERLADEALEYAFLIDRLRAPRAPLP